MGRKWSRRWVLSSVALFACAALAAVGVHRARARGPDTPREQLSYAMGVAIAKSFDRQKVDVDLDVVARGMRDQLSGQKLQMSDAALREAVSSLQGALKEKQAQAMLAREMRRQRTRENKEAAAVSEAEEKAP